MTEQPKHYMQCWFTDTKEKKLMWLLGVYQAETRRLRKRLREEKQIFMGKTVKELRAEISEIQGASNICKGCHYRKNFEKQVKEISQLKKGNFDYAALTLQIEELHGKNARLSAELKQETQNKHDALVACKNIYTKQIKELKAENDRLAEDLKNRNIMYNVSFEENATLTTQLKELNELLEPSCYRCGKKEDLETFYNKYAYCQSSLCRKCADWYAKDENYDDHIILYRPNRK